MDIERLLRGEKPTPKEILDELDRHQPDTELRDIILKISIMKTKCPACSLNLFSHLLSCELWAIGITEPDDIATVLKHVTDNVSKMEMIYQAEGIMQ